MEEDVFVRILSYEEQIKEQEEQIKEQVEEKLLIPFIKINFLFFGFS